MNRNSEKSSYHVVVDALMEDIKGFFPEHQREIRRDVETIRARILHEGDGFLMRALPAFGDAYLQGLETGIFPRIPGFKGRLPKFLRWAICPYYSPDGSLVEEPPYWVVSTVIQLCYFFKKVKIRSEDSVLTRAYADFLERNARARNKLPSAPFLSRAYIANLFGGYSTEKVRPRHGSGAVYEKTGKMKCFRYCSQSEGIFPAKTWFFSDSSLLYSPLVVANSIRYYKSRLVAVPKTAKGPRLIAIEQAQAQYLQQALMGFMYKRINRVEDLRDQSRMHDLTEDYRYVTIDLSEASDSISLTFVEDLFQDVPALLEALLATRSKTVEVEGREHDLAIYATMGNATTFAVLSATMMALTKGMGFRCHVYGDDLVVHRDDLESVKYVLRKYGFKINASKSFTNRMRESCGKYTYLGDEVTPIYLRAEPTPSSNIWSLSETMNLLTERFYHRTAASLLAVIQRRIGRVTYTGSGKFGIISRVNPRDPRVLVPMSAPWCPKLHGYRVRGFGVKSLATKYRVSDDQRYANWLSTLVSYPNQLPNCSVKLVRRTITAA